MTAINSRTTGCLFCGNTQGRFESEEHVIPLALGNTVASGLVDTELVIPPGEICDKCNARRLSLRDNALAGWPPISVFRSLGQIRNRRGNLVDAVAGTAWDIELDPDDPRLFHLKGDADTSRASKRDEVARALCKVALETRWLEDPADARSSRWDALASAAIGGPLPDDLVMGLTYPATPDDVDLAPSCAVHVDGDADPVRMVCELWVVGLRLVLLVGSRPPSLPNTGWWVLDAAGDTLRGPNSMWFSFHGGAERATRLKGPDVDDSPRETSQLPTRRENAHLRLQSTRSRSGSP